MIRQKDKKARSISDEARKAEAKWRTTSLEAAALPPEEIRATHAERRGRLEAQLAFGDERAQSQAAERLRRERDDAREAERLRRRRKRPHKHLPAGLVQRSVVVGTSPMAGVVNIHPCPKDAPGSRTMIDASPTHWTLEVVTPELARDAAGLRAAFDVECDPMAPYVTREIADAIRIAAPVVSAAWISIALYLVHRALLHGLVRKRGAVDLNELAGRPAPPTTPKAIYEALIDECLRAIGFRPPSDVNAGTVAWMLSHLAIGAARGGGRTGRLSAAKMRAVLADERKRARVARPT